METRRRRSARPMMTIDLPPHFDADAEVEEEYLTPPVWVAVNPPPIFERAQMKRTASELSGWCGDEEDQGMRQDGPDTETVFVLLASFIHSPGRFTGTKVTDGFECKTKSTCKTA